MFQDLIGGVLGARADLVRGLQGGGQRVLDLAIEVLVGRELPLRLVELALERRELRLKLAYTLRERAEHVVGGPTNPTVPTGVSHLSLLRAFVRARSFFCRVSLQDDRSAC
ncbi:MAG: hypothetical protein AUH85_00470 [Chloroflexi bacterium 13_1_40CM_4_68_4]|nr:MAG: hypothetical protein AUH85_00470 [Chloroflexi bacterium 13_1_40CM_4_68_4]